MSNQMNAMKVVFFTAGNKPEVKQLKRVIAVHLPKERIAHCQTLEGLLRRLHRPLTGQAIYIFLVFSRKELSDILSLRDLLQDRKIILILPDDGTETLAMAHALRPRFLTYLDRDFVDVSAVLGRMIAANGLSRPIFTGERDKENGPPGKITGVKPGIVPAGMGG